MKKFLAAAAAIALSGAVAFAANIPLLSGPNYSDPSQVLGTANAVIQAVNTGVGGLINAQTATVSTGAGTTEQILQTYTMPANQLSTAGQSVRVRCWGRTAANGNNKTRKLYFGANVISTATEAANDQPWFLELLVMRTGAATQVVNGNGMAGTGGITNLNYSTTGTEDLTAGVVIKCTGTDGTDSAGDIITYGMITEQIK